MHVLIDALSARIGGGVTRSIGIVDALTRVAPQHTYTLIVASHYQPELIKKLPAGVSTIEIDVRPNLLARAWFQNFRLPAIARSLGADIVFAAGEGAYIRAPRLQRSEDLRILW